MDTFQTLNKIMNFSIINNNNRPPSLLDPSQGDRKQGILFRCPKVFFRSHHSQQYLTHNH